MTELRKQCNLRSKPKVEQLMATDTDKNLEKPIAAPLTGPIELLNLNRNCLLHIFSFLDVSDLHTAANVCKQFRELAEDEFQHNHKYFEFSSLIDTETETMACYGKAKCVLFKFGEFIRKLNFSGYVFHERSNQQINKLLLEVGRYCDNGTLTEMIMDDIFFNFDIVRGVELLFLSIENLEIISSDLKSFNNAHFPCLKVLSIKSCGPFGAFIINSIRTLANSDCHIEHFELLDRISVPQKASIILGSIKSLKILKFNCNRHSAFDLLAALVKNAVKIEHLHIAHGILDVKGAKMFAEMDKLTHLELNAIKTEERMELGTLLKNLPTSLQEFHIKTEQPFSVQKLKALLTKLVNLSIIRIDSPHLFISLDAYNEFIEILKKRPIMIFLKIVIYGNGLQMVVPKNVCEANKFWIEISEENSDQESIFPQILLECTGKV